MVRLDHRYLSHQPTIKTVNSLEDTGAKNCGEIEGGHAVFLVVALHKGEELAEIAEEAVVDVWKLLQQISHV